MPSMTLLKNTFKKPASRLRNRLARGTVAVQENEDGLAAIEFALLAPLLITMYFGLAEVASAISVNRAVSHSTNVAGDLATQVADIEKEDLEDLMTATLRVMAIPEPQKVTIQLDSWTRDSAGKDILVGSATMNGGASKLPSFNVAKVDKTLLNENSGIVVARVAYDYSPFKAMFFDSDITMSESFVLKPRRSSSVTFDGTTGKKFTCSSNGTSVKCG
jgi:Flp pilus assembly protein TadG